MFAMRWRVTVASALCFYVCQALCVVGIQMPQPGKMFPVRDVVEITPVSIGFTLKGYVVIGGFPVAVLNQSDEPLDQVEHIKRYE